RGVGADDGLGARRLGDLPEYRGLDLEVLEDRFEDEVGGGRGLVDRARGREVVPDRRGRAAREQAAVLESLRLLDEPMVSCGRDLGAPIGDQHGEARANVDLGDAAAHVSGADDGAMYRLRAYLIQRVITRYARRKLGWTDGRRQTAITSTRCYGTRVVQSEIELG